jgi:hypothetical protein
MSLRARSSAFTHADVGVGWLLRVKARVGVENCCKLVKTRDSVSVAAAEPAYGRSQLPS